MGGVISGYCATGNLNTATRPAKVMMIDGTEARMGRSMKKRENIAAPLVRRLSRLVRLSHLDAQRRRRDILPGHAVRLDRTARPARCKPLTMIQSSGPMPDSITLRPSCRRPTVTGRYSTSFLPLTAKRYLLCWAVPMARSLTSRARCGWPNGIRTARTGRESNTP